MPNAIYAQNFTKSYGTLIANKGIDMEINTGEILGY